MWAGEDGPQSLCGQADRPVISKEFRRMHKRKFQLSEANPGIIFTNPPGKQPTNQWEA